MWQTNNLTDVTNKSDSENSEIIHFIHLFLPFKNSLQNSRLICGILRKPTCKYCYRCTCKNASSCFYDYQSVALFPMLITWH